MENEIMESWRHVWRKGLAPLLSDAHLQALRKALREDDPRLRQGQTTDPPPLQCVQDWPCEGACLVGYAGWQADGLQTVGEIEEFFARMCYRMDENMGEPAACRWLLNWYDDTPRLKMRENLLSEVELEIMTRDADGQWAAPDAVAYGGED
jgi:hypothetical protein